MRKLVLISLLVFLCIQVQAQTDSLLNVLKTAKEDENKILLLFKIGQEFENSDLESAKSYYLQARALGKKISYPLTEVKFISNYTFALNMQGKLDSSLVWNLKGIEEAKKLGDDEQLAKAYFNTGTSYQYLHDYESAVKYYQKGLVLFDKINNKVYTAQANDILQHLYTSMKQYDRAKKHGRSAVSEFRKLDQPKMLAYSLCNLGVVYGYTNQKDSALIYFKEAEQITKNIDDQVLRATVELNLADVYLWKKQFEKSKKYYESVLRIVEKNDLPESKSTVLRGLSYYYMYMSDYEKSLQYGEQALAISRKYQLRDDHILNLDQMASLAYINKDTWKGKAYEIQSQAIRDSLMNEQILQNTINTEKRFELDKKNTQLQLQQETIDRKNLLNWFLIGGLIALLLIGVLGYRNYQHRKKLQQQRINELETEKQLSATEAILKGEEQERTRLAKDLHDGLGGMLSGIKYSFQNMKENLILTPENAHAFERSIDMLDSSIKEMRRVAHNMMPEMLVRYGLNVALKEFCNEINRSGVLKTTYQFIGVNEISIEQTNAVTVYRIIQELVHNAIKHANAKNLLVQIHTSQEERMLSVIVEDDGKGFDVALIQDGQGMGWRNVQNRIEFLKGKIDLNSAPHKGTSILMEIPLS